jgi:hypothetical protein
LAALAGLALLLAWPASGGRPDPMALAQEGATSTSTWTPRPPFTSPLSTPAFTATPHPTPVPRPIEFITDPREVYALSQRYRFLDLGDGDPQGADASETQRVGGEAQPMHAPLARSLYFPLIRRSALSAWYKGTGQSIVYREHSFVYKLGITWWYDWQHDYAWYVTGRIAEPRYQPMVWCPNLPGEPGVPPGYSEPDRGLWNPLELADKTRRYPGRTWLIFNEPDFPPSIHPDTPTMYSYQQCGQVLCGMANYATLPAPVVLPPNMAPTPTQTWTPTPIPPPGSSATATPTPVWPCSWPVAGPTPTYYPGLRAKMIRMAADRYAQIYRIIKANDPTAKVFCCGNFDAGYTTWLADFLQQLRLYHSDVKIDGLAIHAYPWGSSVRDCWNAPKESIWECMARELEENRNDFHGTGSPLVSDAPLWITETGYLGIPQPTPTLTAQEVQQYVMDPMIVWLQSGVTGYQAVAWFISIGADPPQTNLFVPTAPEHTPSAMAILGARWATVTPARAP